MGPKCCSLIGYAVYEPLLLLTSVGEVMNKTPSMSPYLVTLPGWQIFLACGSQSIMEASRSSGGVASLIGAYYLFNFSYPPSGKWNRSDTRFHLTKITRTGYVTVFL